MNGDYQSLSRYILETVQDTQLLWNANRNTYVLKNGFSGFKFGTGR